MNRKRVRQWMQRLCLLLLCLLLAPFAYAAGDVHVIAIDGEIDGTQAALVQRVLADAADNDDAAVVVSVNTLGGRVDSALKIRDALQQASIPTIAYIPSRAWSAGALIALSCRHIVMAPGSSIGAAEPIPDTEKNIAALRAEFAATAGRTGHNPRVAEAMVDKTLGFPGYAEPGQLLSLTDRQAADLDISEGSAADVGAALGLFSLGDARLIYEERGLRDGAVGVLQYEYVRMVLVALILMAILAEIKTAGIGAGLVTAVLLGAMLFVSGDGSFADSLKIGAAFIGSLVLIALELVTPGVGIFGISGVILLFASLFYLLGATAEAVYLLAGAVLIAAIFFVLVGRRLPQSRLLNKLALKDRSTKEKGYSSQEDKSRFLHQEGTTITILRPAGTIRIGKERVDAVTDGAFIDRDTPVRVVRIDGGCVVVEPSVKDC